MADSGHDNGAARAAILSKVRASLGVSGDEMRTTRVDRRLADPPRGLIPKRGEGDGNARRHLLRTMMEAADTTVDEIDTADDIPNAIANYLKTRNLPAQLRIGDDPLLNAVDWTRQPLLDVRHGRADPSDPTAVSAAFAAVAESGTLILHAGPENPTTLNFLPETHIVVVRARDIEGDYETVWTRLREKFGAGQMPRVVNMVSGPSRTADIEQTLLLGAHGPKSLHLIILR